MFYACLSFGGGDCLTVKQFFLSVCFASYALNLKEMFCQVIIILNMRKDQIVRVASGLLGLYKGTFHGEKLDALPDFTMKPSPN